MKASELNQLSLEELSAKETTLRKELFELRNQAVTQKLENPSKLGVIRKDIARILTARQSISSKKEGAK